MSKFQVTAIESDRIERRKYISDYEFDSLKAAEDWIRRQFRTEYCEHYDIADGEFDEDDYSEIEMVQGRAEYEIGESEYLYLIYESRDPLNCIDSFMYYMWNAFCDDEILCKIHWHCNADHILSKWHHFYNKYGPNGAIAPFFGELDGDNRQALVDRAVEMYDGKHNTGAV